MPPTAVELARFQAALTRAKAAMGWAASQFGDEMALAVSGGPDSLALLVLAAHAFPGRVRAATVDHGLRRESRAEADGVAAACAMLGVSHSILDRTSPGATNILENGDGGALQARARQFRYGLLGRWCADAGVNQLATAHHADDQAETLLMRVARGAGLQGLSGIRAGRLLKTSRRLDLPEPHSPRSIMFPYRVALVRPVLSFGKEDLARIVERAGLVAVDDPFNFDPRFRRSHARELLAANRWLRGRALATSVQHLSEADAALTWAANREAERRLTVTDLSVAFDWEGLPDELIRRIVNDIQRHIVSRNLAIAEHEVDVRDPTILIARLKAGEHATLGGIRARPGPRWRFSPAPPHRSI